MDVDEVVDYWLKSAAEDWPVVEHLVDGGAYHHALFFGHLYLEKLLKAMVVNKTGRHAPRSHNLLFLAEHAGLSIADEQRDFLLRITAYNIDTRYPQDVETIHQHYSREHTEQELQSIQEMAKWLKLELNRARS